MRERKHGLAIAARRSAGFVMGLAFVGFLLVVGADARGDVVSGGFLRRFFEHGTARPQVNEINAGTGIDVVISGSRATLNVSGGGGPATQIRESSGPTTLDVGAIGTGQCLVRSGATVIGQTLAAVASSGSATDLSSGTVAYARLPVGTGANTVLAGTTAFVGTIQDEAASLTQRSTVNFTGSGVSCGDNAGSSRTDCTISGGYQTVGVNGTSQTQRGRVNFVNTSVLTWAGADNAGTNSTDVTPTIVTVPAGQTPVGATRTLTCGAGLTGCGDLSADRTIAVDHIRAALAHATLQTTDAVQTTIFSYTVPTGTMVRVWVVCTALRSDSAAGGTYQRIGGWKNNAGTVTLVGAGVSPGTPGDLEDAALAAADITIDISSTTVRARLTGIGATTINWDCYGQTW